jgi:hypothetical protein
MAAAVFTHQNERARRAKNGLGIAREYCQTVRVTSIVRSDRGRAANPEWPCSGMIRAITFPTLTPSRVIQEIEMLRAVFVRTIGVALFGSMTVAACSAGAPPVETGIPVGRAVAPSTVAPGATIRFVVGTDSRLIVGHLSKLSADSLIIERCANCDRLRYGTLEISRLEVRRGSSRGRHFGHGLVFGVLAGLIAAVLVDAQPCHSDGCGFGAAALLIGPAEGALIGGIIGVALPTGERWEPVASQRAVQ